MTDARPSRRVVRACGVALTVAAAFAASAVAEDPPPGGGSAPAATSSAPSSHAAVLRTAARLLRAGDAEGALRLLAPIPVEPCDVDVEILVCDAQAARPDAAADRVAALRRRATDRPDDPVAAYLAARTLAPRDALAAYRAMETKFPKSPWPTLGRAESLARLGRVVEAVPLLDAAVLATPGAVRLRAARALLLESLERWEDALLDWKVVVAARADDVGAHLGAGQAQRGRGDRAAAIAEFGIAEKLDPADPEPPLRIALVQLEQDDCDAAVAACERSLARAPKSVEALCTAATAAMRGADAKARAAKRNVTPAEMAPALAYADRAIAAAPDAPRPYLVRGFVRETLAVEPFPAPAAPPAPAPDAPPGGPPPSGDSPPADAPAAPTAREGALALALADYTAAVERTPMPGALLVRALVSRAHVEYLLGKYDECVADALRATDLQPLCEAAWADAGDALTLAGKPADAIRKAWKPGIKNLPDSARLHHGLGMTLWTSDHAVDGLKELKEAVRLQPTNGRWRLSYGEALYQAMREKEARPELVEATNLRDDRLSWACLGHALVSLQKWDDAVLAYEQVCKLDPAAVDEHLYLAVLYADRLTDKEKAKEHAKLWVDRGGTEPNLGPWVAALLEGK